MATFYVIGTPIGNLEDITLRALRILGEVDLILCEDTRVTRKLLERHNISTPCESYHAHSTDSKIEKILEMLGGGDFAEKEGIASPKNIALVSDAGTPGISDPGSHLVGQIRAKFAEQIAAGEIKIEAVPGPSAVTAALSIAGIECSQFTFLGFLPHKKGRETLFKEIKIITEQRPVIFYESPHRIMKTLQSLGEHLPADQKIVIVRELTKIYEEVVRGTPAEVTAHFEKNAEKVRGEFVVIVEIA
jgi:16S rRNA (cytidine1402-2'-O)-methyltransferase